MGSQAICIGKHVDIDTMSCSLLDLKFTTIYMHVDFTMIIVYVYVFRFGRKTAFMLSFMLHLGGGFGSAFAPNYGTFVACRFITGMSNMGMFMSTFVIGKPCLFLSKYIHSRAWRKRKLKRLHEDIVCCIVTQTYEFRYLINIIFNGK